MIGIIYDMQGKRDEARKQYERALTMDPRRQLAANNLACHYARNGRKPRHRPPIGSDRQSKAAGQCSGQRHAGVDYHRKGLTSLAIGQLREGVQQNPVESAHPLSPRARLFQERRHGPEARRSLERALKLNPKFPGPKTPGERSKRSRDNTASVCRRKSSAEAPRLPFWHSGSREPCPGATRALDPRCPDVRPGAGRSIGVGGIIRWEDGRVGGQDPSRGKQ